MTQEWETLVPPKYISKTKCYHVLKQFSYAGPKVQIVICTAEGRVVEFFDQKIVGSCDTPCINATRITYFTCFDSQFHSYYVVEWKRGVLIVARKDKLQIMKQYDNVKKTTFDDFTNSGFPQLGMWTSNSDFPDIIEDFKESTKSSENHSCTNIINEKCKELQLRVKELEHKLQLKKQLRYQCSKPHVPGLQLVQLVGSESSHVKESKELTLQVASTWQRVHFNKWVIGVVVSNTGHRTIRDVKLLLQSQEEQRLCYVSKLLKYCVEEPPDPSEVTRREEQAWGISAWSQTQVLQPKRRHVLSAVVDVPKFLCSSVVTLTALVTYRIEDSPHEAHLTVPSFRYKVLDLCRRVAAPFSLKKSEEDMLGVLLTSKIHTLRIKYESFIEPSLQDVLITKLHFEEIPSMRCLYHRGQSHPELQGMLLYVDTLKPLSFRISICSREMQQVYLLLHCLFHELFSPAMQLQPAHLVTPPLTRLSHDEYLRAETELVLQELKQWMVERPGSMRCLKPELRIPLDKYHKFRSELMQLEARTDTILLTREVSSE